MPVAATFRLWILLLVALSLRLQGADTLPRDLAGQVSDPLADTPAGTVVLIFVATDCPISNRYAPVVNDLVRKFSSSNLRFFAVYPDATATPSAIRKHREAYGYTLPALLDPGHVLAGRAGATVTPEAAVLLLSAEAGAGSRLIYRGRIDNRHESPGRSRPEATRHDLREVLAAIAGGTIPAPRITRAVGCYIE